jgi:hypothetical protein
MKRSSKNAESINASKGVVVTFNKNMESKANDTPSKYYFVNDDHIYKIMYGESRLNNTNGGASLAIPSEKLAKRIVDHLNTYGNEFEEAKSILAFFYPENQASFFGKAEYNEALSEHLREQEWTFDCTYQSRSNINKWNTIFGTKNIREKEIYKWINGLNRLQTYAAFVLTGVMGSVNVPYIISKNTDYGKLAEVTYEMNRCQRYYNKKCGNMRGYSNDELVKIFDNYLLYIQENTQEVGIMDY